MICPNCGKETGGKFCPHCGTRMPEAAPSEPIVPPLPDPAASAQEPELSQNFGAQAERPKTQTPEPGAWNPPAPQGQPGQQPPAAAPAYGYALQAQPGFGANSRPANPQPGQAYAGGPGYVPAQGGNPQQGYAAPAQLDPGNSPARMLIRKLASSPLYLLAVICFTAGLVISAIPYVQQLVTFFRYFDYYRSDSGAWATVVGYVLSILVELLLGVALWSVFFAALRRHPVQMRTGGLSALKLYLIVGMVLLILALLAVAGLTVYVAAAADRSVLEEIHARFLELLRQYNYTYEETAGLPFRSMLIVTGCSIFLGILISVIFFGKLIKTINTVKRVVRIGYPDDRVSPFAGVLCILIGLADILAGVAALVGKGNQLLEGVAILCSALCLIFFGVLIFQYRGKMRALGVYRGVSTPNPNR